jgi:hypothetical protein
MVRQEVLLDADPTIDTPAPAWMLQVWVSFLVAAGMTVAGTLMLPVDWWCRGYLLMGELFLTGSTFTLAKTVRDNHEARKLRNRISQAKSTKLLKEYELTDAA